MKTTKDKYNFQYTFKLGLILSLVLLICIFLFYPVSVNVADKNLKTLFDKNDIVFIPATTQYSKKTQAPKIPQLVISETDIELPILEDVTITSVKAEDTKLITAKNLLPKYYQPRQTLEVIPQNLNDNIKGFVKISIQVGSDGKPKSYKILANTTESKECLREVINAVFKSRWESFNLISSAKDYWINKTYRFN